MCKKVVIKTKIDWLILDRNIDYKWVSYSDNASLSNVDIFITDSVDLFILASDIKEVRKINRLCRIVVFPFKYHENIIASIFPFVEFVRRETKLSDIVYSKSTYFFKIKKEHITKREEFFLSLLGFGLRDGEVAESMSITRRSVSRMKQRVIDKTGLISTTQLYLYGAFQNWAKGEFKE